MAQLYRWQVSNKHQIGQCCRSSRTINNTWKAHPCLARSSPPVQRTRVPTLANMSTPGVQVIRSFLLRAQT